ncbi:MAG: gliding motility-associated C-terminal domain-containing protein [Fulvivirga sp.]|uniref:gliding motility-associated C-terminal domain-containing protein n=1 Tax=Fulvivirga sp. TaxID=1931237 RepID=UPI0032EBA23D
MKNLVILMYILLSITANAQRHENQSINYRVVAVSSENSRVESVSNEVKLYLPMKIYLPTAFTPNGDGLNDTFGAIGEGIENFRLEIFNRWGESVYSSDNAAAKWDGRYNGKPVPVGSYNYKLTAYGKEFGEVNKTGRVTVLN